MNRRRGLVRGRRSSGLPPAASSRTGSGNHARECTNGTPYDESTDPTPNDETSAGVHLVTVSVTSATLLR